MTSDLTELLSLVRDLSHHSGTILALCRIEFTDEQVSLLFTLSEQFNEKKIKKLIIMDEYSAAVDILRLNLWSIAEEVIVHYITDQEC